MLDYKKNYDMVTMNGVKISELQLSLTPKVFQLRNLQAKNYVNTNFLTLIIFHQTIPK